ncbi:MAG TPA: FAD-binding oxidoreductase [Gammaproteobacteria bacterium]|nr:FAD-binding oxidoreductase [Gammaproteobacteria bacterium]
MTTFDAVVIGGGLVGAALSFGLTGHGLTVAMLDEGDTALRASRGNFGLVWVQGKGLGRPEYARWSRRSAGNWSDFATELTDLTDIDIGFSRPGGLLVALTENELAGYVEMLEALRSEAGNDGYEFELLDHRALSELLPGIGAMIPGATYCPYDGHANPLHLLHALHAGFIARGGRYYAEYAAKGIEAHNGGFRIHTETRVFEGARVVIAAGLGSATLGTTIGLTIPVVPLQGQLMVTERSAPRFELPTNLVRQTNEGSFLLGYSQEDLGFDTDTDAPTLRDIAWRCIRAFPFLADLRVVRAWGALRIMTPDGFPVYAQSASHPGAFAVTCHSGVTLAANHALDVSKWIAAGSIPDAYGCFGLERFDVSPAA